MTQPVRLQLSRAKGFNLQAVSRALNGLSAVKVTRPGMFGNSWTIEGARSAGFTGDDLAQACVNWFSNSINHDLPATRMIVENISVLRGKNLACWCKIGQPCHADVLLELANRPICEEVKP